MAHTFMVDETCHTGAQHTSAIYTVTLKLRELHLNIPHKATVRVGWMSSEMSVFTHWKEVRHGRVGWKSSLVQQLTTETTDIILVIYQKVGDCEMPVGLRRIPCSGIFVSERKHLFRVPIEEMVKGEGTLVGSVRAKIDRSEDHDYSHLEAEAVNYCNTEGSVSSKSSGTGCSIDMSLDLTTEVPTVIFPLITTHEVYQCIIRKHHTISPWKHVFVKVLETLLQSPTGMKEFVVPNACDRQELTFIPHSLIEELQLRLRAVVDNGQKASFFWDVSRASDFDILREVILGFLETLQNESSAGDTWSVKLISTERLMAQMNIRDESM